MNTLRSTQVTKMNRMKSVHFIRMYKNIFGRNPKCGLDQMIKRIERKLERTEKELKENEDKNENEK